MINHFDHWFAKLIGRCITIGRHVFYTHPQKYISSALMRHEAKHVEQYQRYVLFGCQWIAILRFWCVYLWQWAWVAKFRYTDIPFEIEARAAEHA